MSSTTSRLIFSSGWDSRKISQPGKYISSRKLFFICLCIPFSMWRYFGEEKEWNLYRGIEPLLKNGTHIEKYLESLLRNGTHIEEWNRYCGMEHIQRNGTVIEEWNRYWGMEPIQRNGTSIEEWNAYGGRELNLRNGTHTKKWNPYGKMEPIWRNGTLLLRIGTHAEEWKRRNRHITQSFSFMAGKKLYGSTLAHTKRKNPDSVQGDEWRIEMCTQHRRIESTRDWNVMFDNRTFLGE